MQWLGLLLVFSLYGLAFLTAKRLGKRYLKLANGLSIACVVLILFHLFLFYNPQVEFALSGFSGYMTIRQWWMPLFIFFLLGLALGMLPERRKRIGIGVLAGVVALYFLVRFGASAAFNPEQLTGAPVGAGQVCRQTTGFSCGAAAASTLLAQVNVPSTEREMAVLCGTNALSGTDVLGVMWGLREKLTGTPYTPKVVKRADLATLRNLRQPAMAVMKLNLLIDHWIVVVRVTEDGVLIGDPLRDGLVLRDTAEFMQNFRGILVTLESSQPELIVKNQFDQK